MFAPEDCAAAAENMMLAADALGIGSCYIGQGWTAFADPHPGPKPRKDGRILWMENRDVVDGIKAFGRKAAGHCSL